MLLIYIDTQSFSYWCDVCFNKEKKIGAQKKKGKEDEKGRPRCKFKKQYQQLKGACKHI